MPDEDFEMHWDVEPRAQKLLDEIAKAVKGADKLILATDPDREGEAISWHVYQVLSRNKALAKVAVERVVFNAVTKEAVLDAMRHPREIDGPLVNAYLARRALDYLVGFTLSPVLWRKLPGARSAGRVQSVALRLVCDRELEIEKFKTQEYWSLEADLATKKAESFLAVSSPSTARSSTSSTSPTRRTRCASRRRLEGASYAVVNVEAKSQRRHPAPPFTTSTLQQEASRKLGFSPRHTMQLAQRLYEGVDMGGESEGLITYMRTDGVQIVAEATAAARRTVEQLYGRNYVPPSPRQYETKAKNAQEAHEAIRPTDFGKPPEKVARYLDGDALKLYKLVWQRTLASQIRERRDRAHDRRYRCGRQGRRHLRRPRHRPGRPLRRLPQALRGRHRRFRQRERRAAAGACQGRSARCPQDRGEAAFHRAAAPLYRGEPHQEDGGTRHRPALDLCLDAQHPARPRICAARQEAARAGGQGAARHRLPREFLRPLCRVRLHRRSRGEARSHLLGRARVEGRAARLLARLHRRRAGHRRSRIAEVLEALNEILGPHVFPATSAGGDPRACPSCGNGRLSLKIGKFGAFIGCSNYPECHFTRQLADGGEKTALLRRRGQGARHRSRDGA